MVCETIKFKAWHQVWVGGKQKVKVEARKILVM